jgi:probable phosphoglycerate mutase
MDIVLVRHGETEWSKTGLHTGRTDVALTDDGRKAARALGPRLDVFELTRVLTSPLSRAKDTCVLAGFGDRCETTDALLEWNYGEHEGKTTAEIRKTIPDWSVFTHGCPGGEMGADVARRVDGLIEQLETSEGDVALFAHGHVLRVLAARWLGLGPEGGRLFALDTGSISILGWERDGRVIRRWNS